MNKKMKKSKTLLALLMVLALVLASFSGCGDQEKKSDGGDANATPQTAEEAAAELYGMLPDTSLSGVMDPNALKDRTDINKALPFKPKDPQNVVIGWTEITQSDPWFVSVKDSAEKWAKEYGYTLYFDVADSDLQKQSAHIDSYITRGVDIIVIDPTDVTGVSADIQRAVDAGIPVIGFGSEIFGAPVITTVNANVFEVGFAAGEYIATQFEKDEQINTGIILGVMGNSTAEGRVNGMLSGLIYGRAEQRGSDCTREQAILAATKLFKSVVKSGKFDSKEWNIACLGWGAGNWTEEGGLKVAEDILTANQDKLNLMIAENDFQGLGAAKAIENYSLKDQIKIASPGNGMKNELEKVKDGTLLCSGPHNGTAFAMETIKMIKSMAEGTNTWDENNLPSLTAFEAFSINRDNIDEHWDDDAENLYHKTPPLKILTVPELKEALEDGSYYAK